MSQHSHAEQAANTVTGRCDCGAVRFFGTSVSDVTLCFCKQCQRQTSYAIAASHVPLAGFEIDDAGGALVWYQSSASARRGFCGRCGSTLFWRSVDPATGGDTRDHISVMVGALDDTSALKLGSQIYVDGAQAYHSVDPSVPARTERDITGVEGS